MPSASALRSAAAIEAYTAAVLYSTLARSKVIDGKEMEDSPVKV